MRLFLLIAFTIVSFVAPTFASSSCNIKGNVWFNTKEKIYHLPGCDSYSSTKIDTNYGERWFCTEQEAIDAGRRKASNCPVTTTSSTIQPTQSTVSNDGIYYVSSWKSVLDFGYANWLTIFNEVSKFRPADDLLREESTKFFTQAFDKLFSSTTLSSTSSCAFSDITTADQTLIPFIVQSCEKWIFKWSDGKFWPKRKLTNAEAIAVVIRMIDGMLDEKTTPWYGSYYTKLASYAKQYPSVNIVYNRMIDPASNAKRGDVLELIYSLYKWVFYKDASDFSTTVVDQMLEVNQCKDPMMQLSCALWLPDCSAKCKSPSQETSSSNTTSNANQSTQTTPGKLSVSLSSWSPDDSTIPPTWIARLGVIDFAASSDGDVVINAITIENIWSPMSSSTRVWLANNWGRVSNRASFDANGKATISIAPGSVVKANRSQTLELYVDLSAEEGQTFKIKSTNIEASASSINGWFTTATFTTVVAWPPTIAFSKLSDGNAITQNDSTTEIWSFSISVSGWFPIMNPVFKGVSLKQKGSASLNNLSNIILERDGQIVADKVSINGSYLTFSSANNEIQHWTTATYYIKAIVTGVDQGKTYQLGLNDKMDILLMWSDWFGLNVLWAQDLGVYTVQ